MTSSTNRGDSAIQEQQRYLQYRRCRRTEEHERFEREFWLKVHREEPPKISPLPEFYQQTRAAFKVLANAGGGAMRSLSKDSHINQQVLVLAFGEQWQNQVAAFGRGITSQRS